MDHKLMKFNKITDDRGSLVAIEANRNIPFNINRMYYIFGPKAGVRRGYHAHRQLKEVLIVVRGSCKVLLDDGREKHHVLLSSSDEGLFLEGMIWREMYDFSSDCVLLVLASEYYDESDYIRDYNTFLSELNIP